MTCRTLVIYKIFLFKTHQYLANAVSSRSMKLVKVFCRKLVKNEASPFIEIATLERTLSFAVL